MKGSVSLEMAIITVVVVFALTLLTSQVDKIITLEKNADPTIMVKTSAMKIVAITESVKSCPSLCSFRLTLVVPRDGSIEVSNGEVRAYIGNDLVYTGAPAPDGSKTFSEGIHQLTIKGSISGVNIE